MNKYTKAIFEKYSNLYNRHCRFTKDEYAKIDELQDLLKYTKYELGIDVKHVDIVDRTSKVDKTIIPLYKHISFKTNEFSLSFNVKDYIVELRLDIIINNHPYNLLFIRLDNHFNVFKLNDISVGETVTIKPLYINGFSLIECYNCTISKDTSGLIFPDSLKDKYKQYMSYDILDGYELLEQQKDLGFYLPIIIRFNKVKRLLTASGQYGLLLSHQFE